MDCNKSSWPNGRLLLFIKGSVKEILRIDLGFLLFVNVNKVQLNCIPDFTLILDHSFFVLFFFIFVSKKISGIGGYNFAI